MQPYGVDICILEDDAAQRAYLAGRLRSSYSIVEAADGLTGIARIREYRPRVVICDLLMPGLNGLGVCRQVRSDPSLTGTYFIFITSCEDRETKHVALNLGADDYLTKPYNFEEFCARLRNGLRISRLQERLQVAALTDGLTGLWNHAHFRHLLDIEFARTRRYGGDVSLLMIDLDHFKAVNDTYGHEVGNHVLISMARHAKRLARDTDIVARYGGEEFAIVCPRTNCEEARALAERIRSTVPTEVRIPDHPETQITTSVGVVCSADSRVATVLDLINVGDRALYEAKHRGRNRVATSEELRGDDSDLLEVKELERLNRQVASLSMQTRELCLQSVWALVQALEARDPHTAQHSRNTKEYAQTVARAAGWPDKMVGTVGNAAMLHDLGKIGIPDRILQKNGPLTPAESAAVRQVPQITCKILEPLRIFETELMIIRHLRERFDGSGYPDGLAGPAIPIGARLLAVAEAFDALTSHRSHRQGLAIDTAIDLIRRDAGEHFDPQYVDLLADCGRKHFAEWNLRINESRAACEDHAEASAER